LLRCKINKNMESGDIIYLILLVFFMLLGFFNDSRKKKNQQAQQASDNPKPITDEETWYPQRKQIVKHLKPEKPMPPPVTSFNKGETVRREFQSSLDLVSISSDSSQEGISAFDYDTGTIFDSGIYTDNIAGISDMSEKQHDKNSGRQKTSSWHPIVDAFSGDEGREELKKAVLYSEILRRRY